MRRKVRKSKHSGGKHEDQSFTILNHPVSHVWNFEVQNIEKAFLLLMYCTCKGNPNSVWRKHSQEITRLTKQIAESYRETK